MQWDELWAVKESGLLPGPGLLNFGVTCFANTALHCLFNNAPFVQILFNDGRHALAGMESPTREGWGHGPKVPITIMLRRYDHRG